MPRNENHVCENCVFWKEPKPNEEPSGACRKSTPVIAATNVFHYQMLRPAKEEDPFEEFLNQGYWPSTWPDDWCGEFQAATENGVGS